MLVVKTYLAPSSGDIGGVGLFAGQDIKQGETVFVLNPQFDMLIDKNSVYSLPEAFREFVLCHGYDREDYPFIILCCDNAKYANHSDDPNVGTAYSGTTQWDFMHTSVALRDIKCGEEMTEDYGRIYSTERSCQQNADFF